MYRGVEYNSCIDDPNPSADHELCQEFYEQRKMNMRLERVKMEHINDSFPTTRLLTEDSTEVLCWEAPRVGADAASDHSSYLSGKHGWCGVCHSDDPGTPGYCLPAFSHHKVSKYLLLTSLSIIPSKHQHRSTRHDI